MPITKTEKQLINLMQLNIPDYPLRTDTPSSFTLEFLQALSDGENLKMSRMDIIAALRHLHDERFVDYAFLPDKNISTFFLCHRARNPIQFKWALFRQYCANNLIAFIALIIAIASFIVSILALSH